MLEQYKAKMKELLELGQQILDKGEYNEEVLDEIECMAFHLDVGYDIIEGAENNEEEEEDDDE